MLSEQLRRERQAGIGGSDAPAVLGVSKWRTAVDVYMEKTGQMLQDQSEDEPERLYWGSRLEDIVAREYARRNGVAVRKKNALLRHPELNHMIASLDRTIDNQRTVLEIKTADRFAASQWGPSGTDQVPEPYIVQVTHYMIVTGYDRAELAVLIGGNEYRQYTIPFDRGLADIIIDREAEFWQHVQTRTPPPPQTVGDIDTLFAIDSGKAMLATPEMERAYDDMRDVRAAIKNLEQRKTSLETALKLAMLDASVLVDSDNRPLITWRKSKDSRRLDAKALAAAHPDIVEQFSIDVVGFRRFMVKEPAE